MRRDGRRKMNYFLSVLSLWNKISQDLRSFMIQRGDEMDTEIHSMRFIL